MKVIQNKKVKPLQLRDSYVQPLTVKGQVTIPIDVRKYLGIDTEKKVVISIENGKVVLSPMEMTLDDVFGFVPPLKEPKTDTEISEILADERAERNAKILRESAE